MDNAQRGRLFFFKWGVFDPIYFELPGKALVQSNVRLEIRGISRVGESNQEVSHCNHPPCLRKQLLPKSVHSALGVLGMTDLLTVDLEDLDGRDGWILESRIDQQGVAEVSPLLVDILMLHILSSSCPHGFLRSMDITQESRSGGGS